MKRIKEVHINNFKFFPESEPIKIDGKNILLYGENGSGKSSVYWALYTLLESSNKTDPAEIQKYFNKSDPENLINIYATPNADDGVDSYVKVLMDDDSEYEISYQNTTINENIEIKESLLASDFLNYRLLQRSHSVKNSEEIDLFPMFDDAVFGYVQFDITNWHDEEKQTVQLRKADAIYQVVKNGPEKTYPKKNGDLGYPQKTAHNVAYTEFSNLMERFENGLNKLIEDINQRVDFIIQDKLKYNITFHLHLEKTEHVLTLSNYTPPSFSIRLKIDDFNGKGPILKPQSFLNEAKLSAIALAIRLAILEMRIQDAKIKILVLDDLMISLDMSNRDKVVKLFLNEYAWFEDDSETDETKINKGHQTFIFTHDRSLYTFIKNDIENLPIKKSSTWKFIEMYADDIDDSEPNSFEKPKVFYEQNDLAIAVKHYKLHDYPAAANYLRKYSEEMLCNWHPEYCWKDKECKDKSNNKMSLHNILEKTINDFWPRLGHVPPMYLELKKYLRILLNPLSHADVGVERYKGEIKRVIQVVEAIEKLHNKNTIEVIVAGGEEIQIILTNVTGDIFKGVYELSDSFYKITNEAETIKLSTFSGKITNCIKVDVNEKETTWTLRNCQKKEMQMQHTELMNRHSLAGSANWLDDLYKMDGTKLI